MAKAEKRNVQRTVTEEAIVMELSKEEAETLIAVCASIGGDRKDSPRRNTDSIGTALEEALNVAFNNKEYGLIHPVSDSLWFKNYPKEDK